MTTVLTLQRATCRSCPTDIAWAVTTAGKRIPLDVEPLEAGNIEVRPDGHGGYIARVLRAGDHASVGADLFRTHFETCPNADQHRRPRTTTGKRSQP